MLFLFLVKNIQCMYIHDNATLKHNEGPCHCLGRRGSIANIVLYTTSVFLSGGGGRETGPREGECSPLNENPDPLIMRIDEVSLWCLFSAHIELWTR